MQISQTSYDMKAFCINLASDTKRRNHCINQYKDAGIEHEFIEAFDGRNNKSPVSSTLTKIEANYLKSTRIIANKYSFFGKELSKPELACAYSHYKVWERIAKTMGSNHQYFMINEDDFRNGHLTELPVTMEEASRSPFDIIYLGYRGGEPKTFTVKNTAQYYWAFIKYLASKKTFSDKIQRNYILNLHPRKIVGFKHLLRAGMTWGGHAYLITARGATILMKANRNLQFRTDEVLRWVILEGEIQVGMSRQKIFTCADFGSNLRSPKEHNEHHSLFPST